MSDLDCILGLDTGGTKTIALLVNRQGEVVQRLTGPGVDPLAGDGWEAELHRLAEALTVRPIAAALGMTVYGEVAGISARQREVAREAFGPAAMVINDTQIAHEGAFAGGDGVLILSGTGSMAWAKGPNGHVRVGGWGAAIGDEGSAFWIAHAALNAVTREADGRDAVSELTPVIEAETGARHFELIDWAHRSDRATIAALSRKVAELAASGGKAAQAIIDSAAQTLLEQARVARRRAGLPDTARWSFGGSVMKVLARNEILVKGLGRPADRPLHDAVQGAVIAARTAVGW